MNHAASPAVASQLRQLLDSHPDIARSVNRILGWVEANFAHTEVSFEAVGFGPGDPDIGLEILAYAPYAEFWSKRDEWHQWLDAQAFDDSVLGVSLAYGGERR